MHIASRIFASATLVVAFALGGGAEAQSNPTDIAARDLVAAAEREDWESVALYSQRVNDPLVSAYADWLRLQRRQTKAPFSEIASFIDRHPTWPRQTDMRRLAEREIDESVSFQMLMDWFERYPPTTGEGGLAHLDAISRLGNTATIPGLARKYWIEKNFEAATETAYLRAYGRHLDRASHEARTDRLIWQRSHTAARRMVKRLEAGPAKLATARIALLRRTNGVDGAIAQVPDSLRDAPELWFERLQWRRKKENNNGAREILDRVPNPRPRPELWAKEARILARRALSEGHYSEAAALVSNHGLSSGGEFAESEFLAGWLRLSYLAQPNAAEQNFATLYNGVGFPISRARGAYWRARAADARGNTELAREWWQRAATHPTTYYGQLAKRALGETPDHFSFAVPSNPEVRQQFLDQELVQLVHRLHELGADKRLRTFLLHLSGLAKSAEERLLVAQLAHETDRPREAVRAIKRLNQLDNLVGVAGYPLVTVPNMNDPFAPENALVLAVIRQESGFDRTALSRAGARGMMQLMPGTEKQVSRALSLPYTRDKLTTDPAYNIRLGQTYLAQMLDRFAGSPPLALAAYNAGPHRVDRWLKEFGDPRTGQVDMIDWIESIPFSETRNYVQRVSEAATVYRYLLSGAQIAEVGTTPLRP